MCSSDLGASRACFCAAVPWIPVEKCIVVVASHVRLILGGGHCRVFARPEINGSSLCIFGMMPVLRWRIRMPVGKFTNIVCLNHSLALQSALCQKDSQ